MIKVDEYIPEVRPRSRASIEDFAEYLVSAVSPETLEAQRPFPIHEFCEFFLEHLFGVTFGVDRLAPGVEARFEGTELTVDVNVYEGVVRGEPRARFTFAHELGHVVLHAEEIQRINRSGGVGVKLYRTNELKPFRDPE